MNITLKSALFSSYRQYRYWLMRGWDTDKPQLAFIGLNPSTADEEEDDPTIRKVIKIAANNGYGSIVMLNLFAVVSSDPEILRTHNDPVGQLNDATLRHYQALDIVFAWGNFKEAIERAKIVQRMFPNAFCLHKNKNGSPKHPLYCRDK